jgi:hypothetical protein
LLASGFSVADLWDIAMRRAFISSIFGLSTIGFVSAGAADAGSPKNLKGEYAFTGKFSCLFAPGSDPGPGNPTPGTPLPNSGFNAKQQPLVNATAFSNSGASEGVVVFNGDGTGTLKATTVVTTVRPTPGPTGYPSFPASASSNAHSAPFTYVINSDDTFDFQLSGPSTGTFLTGPRTGQTFSVDAGPRMGLISKDGNTLTLATVVPTVETIAYSNGDTWPRICVRSSVLIRMDKD